MAQEQVLEHEVMARADPGQDGCEQQAEQFKHAFSIADHGARGFAAPHPPYFSAVLFDWRGTLFHDESDEAWIRASAVSLGRVLSREQVSALARRLGAAANHPEVVAARQRSDYSRDLHEAAALLELRLAGFDEDLARAICQRDGYFAATMPYVDTRAALEALKCYGVRIGVVSDIHYDLRPLFQHYGLDVYVHAFTLSFEHGVQKPDPRLFAAALRALGAEREEVLMVGDNPARDGGAVRVGITTLILPSVSNSRPRGFESVLVLASALPNARIDTVLLSPTGTDVYVMGPAETEHDVDGGRSPYLLRRLDGSDLRVQAQRVFMGTRQLALLGPPSGVP